MLLQLSQLFHYLPPPITPFRLAIPHLSLCPWVVHVSSLATPFPILFLTSPILYLQFVLFNPCTCSPVLTFPLPADNLPNAISMILFLLVVCLVYFSDSVIDSSAFVAILIFIVLIFFLYSSL